MADKFRPAPVHLTASSRLFNRELIVSASAVDDLLDALHRDQRPED